MKDIYWIAHHEPPRLAHPSLAIVARPRGAFWLEDDLAILKQGGIDILVSLLEPDEAAALGLSAEGELAEKVGIHFLSYPIPDRTVPADSASFRKFIARLVEAVQSGKRVGVHCRGCIGRSTVTAASVLIQLGFTPSDALAMIETARECPIPDTLEQLNWILRFERKPESDPESEEPGQ